MTDNPILLGFVAEFASADLRWTPLLLAGFLGGYGAILVSVALVLLRQCARDCLRDDCH